VGTTAKHEGHAAHDFCGGRPQKRPSDSKFQFEQLGLTNSTSKI
jgi:hypothetical protein